jgi:multiple sugar transport system permease protein
MKKTSRFESKTGGLIGAVEFKRGPVRLLYWLMFALLLLLGAVCLFPPLWVLLSSMKDINEFFAVPPTIIPRTFHPEKLANVWRDMNFGLYYRNSLLMAAGDLLWCLTLNGLAGFVISRLKPKGSTLLFTLIMWTMLMPSSLNLVPLFRTFLDFPVLHLNLTNTFFPMWIMSGANCFYILMFKSFFDTIPASYVEAARIDGCSALGIFGRVILPMSKPIIMVVSIFTVAGSWDNFMWPYLVLKDAALRTVPVHLFTLRTYFSKDLQVAAILFALLPPAALFCVFQKQIMSGANMSGIKG